MIVLLLYAVGCLQVLRLSRRARCRAGMAAASIAIIVSLLGLLIGGYFRALVAPVALVVAGVAAKKAFEAADASSRDTDDERHASQAGMALVGLAIGEATIMLIAGFIWAIDR